VRRPHPKRLATGLAALAVGLFSAVALAGGTTLPTTTLLPVVLTGDVATQSTPFIAWIKDLAADKYLEQEYLVSGKANIYEYTDNLNQKPDVAVQTPDVDYTTRILVRRPTHSRPFNGTVYVEVLNATAGWDGDAIWQATHEYMLREGAIWVGVTTKPVTVNFLRDNWGNTAVAFPSGSFGCLLRHPAPECVRNRSRYSSLSMPHFGQVWDMLSQVGALLKTRHNSSNPLDDFKAKRLVMVGYSQSAAYETTYANSIHAAMPDGSPVYDGYYIATGGSRAKNVTGPPPSTQESLPVGDVRNLTKVDVPVIRFQSQFEVVNSGARLVRQNESDYPLLRFYEGAGLTHVDTYLDLIGGQALVRDLGLAASFCPTPALPINPIRNGYVQAALLDDLDQWIRSEKKRKGDDDRGKDNWAPPASRYLDLTTNALGATVLARDADGNVIGGVRPPDIDVPLGTTLETNTGPGFCGLFGAFAPFSDAKVKTLYPSHDAYVKAFKKAARASEKDGFLLREDAKAQIDAAEQSTVGN